VNLCAKGEKGVVLTGEKKKLLALLGIDSSIMDKLVVGGDWHSNDNIGIHVGSALVSPSAAKRLALALSKEDPFRAWLPRIEEHADDGDEYSRSEKEQFKPWIVWPSAVTRLDETDPLGANAVMRRLHFARTVNAVGMLKATDPFKRTWTDSEGRVAARSEAWGRIRMHEEDAISGERLVCSADFLKTVLTKQRAELLLLVVLRRYDKGIGSRGSQYWHTTAVVRVKQSLGFEFFPGVINELHVMKY
jgi:hypothetical protein